MMLSRDYHGKMTVVENEGIIKSEFCIECNRQFDFNAFYCGKGKALFELSYGEKIEISKGDMAILENVEHDIEINVVLKNSKLVQIDICCFGIK